MNIAEYSIKNKVISWLFLVILAIGGVTSFGNLSRLEDPAFTIKDAMIISTYPGADMTPTVNKSVEVSAPALLEPFLLFRG
jgi:multidrug efflux pump subunit AcrB